MSSLPTAPLATPELICLHGETCSLVLECSPQGPPIWRYWGSRLQATSPAWPTLRDTRPLPSFTLDQDPPLSLVPGLGVGWFGASALTAHRAGRDFSTDFDRCSWHCQEAGRDVTFTLDDTVARVRVVVSLRMEAAHDTLSIATTLHNLGDAPLELQWLAAAVLPLPPCCHTVHSFAGQHMAEFLAQEDQLTRSTWLRENRRGRTSHDCFPGAVVTTSGAGPHAGEVYGAHLAWSGNHRQFIEWLPDGRWQWQLGEWLAPGELSLALGASVQAPEVLASFSQQGFNGLAQNFHAALRQRMRWPGGTCHPRPVHLNTWEAMYFDHQPAALMALADAAAEVGIERFVLDDGWFQGRKHDRAGLGDWWVDRSTYPEGLAPLAHHVLNLGMGFGIWFEPEMVNPDSELFRRHPDWALQIAGRPLLTARNQLVLDLSRAEVSAYLFDRINELLLELPVSYIKWDHNRDLTTAGGPDGRAALRDQVSAAYALIDRLRQAHPALEIESCSGGGGRIDFEILRRTHRVWTSDNIDALSRLAIQRGFAQFFPPEIMGAHIGTAPAHATGRSQSMAFRAAVAFTGHLGVELDIRVMPSAERAELRGWIALHKHWRGLMHSGRQWTGDAGDSVLWQLHGPAQGSDDGNWLFIAHRFAPSTWRYAPCVRLPMLPETVKSHEPARWRLKIVRPQHMPDGALYNGSAPYFDQLASPQGLEVDADWLRHHGLPLPRARGESAFIVHLQIV